MFYRNYILINIFFVKLQGEVARYKRKGKEANLEIVKLRKDLEDMKTAEIKALQAKRYKLFLYFMKIRLFFMLKI